MFHRGRGLVVLAVTLLSVVSVEARAEAPKPAVASATKLEVPRGGQQSLSVPGVTRVALGDATIADVTVAGPDTLSLKGLATGETRLMAWTKDGKRLEFELIVR
jgi:pilus assembly protein CpaC